MADDVRILSDVQRWASEQRPQHTNALNRRAELAADFVARWGMVAAKPEGEDSAGRAKLVLLSPQELVDRSCETAMLIMAEFERREWVVDVPAPVVSEKPE